VLSENVDGNDLDPDNEDEQELAEEEEPQVGLK